MKVWIIVGYEVENNDHFIYEVWSTYEAAKASLDRTRNNKKAQFDRVRFNLETWSVLS